MSSDCKQLAQAAGHTVSRCIDDRNVWLWERFIAGKKVEGSSPIFNTKNAAWQNAAEQTVGGALSANNFSREVWDAMSHRRQLKEVRSIFGGAGQA